MTGSSPSSRFARLTRREPHRPETQRRETQRRETRGPGAVRRRLALVGLGAFLVILGLLLRFYAAPRLIAAPADFYQTDVLHGSNATYFNQGTLTTQRGAALSYTLTIRGDAAASTSKYAVWDQYAVLADPAHNAQVNSTYQRAVFDRRTGELLNCCGASINDNTQIHVTGIGLFWPIGTRKTTYQVFDVNAQSAWPASYSGTAQIQGVTTYRFVQHIPPTQVAQIAGVPLSLLGVHGKTGNVVANRFYQASNTFWVDPRTGVLVDTEQHIMSVLRGPGGEGKLLAADADLKMSQASQKQLAALANKNAMLISTLRVNGPVGGIVVGVILILAGTIPLRRLWPRRLWPRLSQRRLWPRRRAAKRPPAA